MSACQYGFRENNSTEPAITSFYDNLLNNINENKTPCSIFLDLPKAFDSKITKFYLRNYIITTFVVKYLIFFKSYVPD